MPKLTSELKQKAIEYHEWQGDSDIKPVKVVKDAMGAEAVLVRITGLDGALSVLDTIDMDGDVFELCSCPRDEEGTMVEEFEHGESD